MLDQVLEVSDLVALINQTLDYAYPQVVVEGEVSGFKISKNRWVYFDLQDESASVRTFSSVYQLKQPLEDGMRVRVIATPKLHERYGFSLQLSAVEPVGEGAIKRAQELLKRKLAAEGLFDQDRKRQLPKLPRTIGVVSSAQAAGYADFMEILGKRWPVARVLVADVLVQGQNAPAQLVNAIRAMNEQADPPELLVVIRGGGSLEDLQAFNDEEVVRAIVASRMPVVVGVGHETDVSLADLAADVRAATPTHAAQLAVPDCREVVAQIDRHTALIRTRVEYLVSGYSQIMTRRLHERMADVVTGYEHRRQELLRTLRAFDPTAVLRRGYGIVSSRGRLVHSVEGLQPGDDLTVKIIDGTVITRIEDVRSDSKTG